MEQLREMRTGVLDAIYGRRAVRSYSAEKPSDATIQALLEAAVHAPTAMLAEQWRFVVIQDKHTLKRYSDRAKAMMLQEAEEHFERFPGRYSRDELLARLSDPSFNIFYDAGTLIVICRNTAGKYADADCWLAAQNLMLAAYAENLGSCCIGFAVPVLNAPDVKRELGIPESGAAVAPIIVGNPTSRPPEVERKAPQILCWLR